MGYKTFLQLPKRPSINSNDFLISDRENASSSPEARINVDVFKDYILTGSLNQNGFLQKDQQVNIDTKLTSIDIKNGNNLITFDDLNKNVYGFFEIRCSYAQASSSLAAIYNLSWIYTEPQASGKIKTVDKDLTKNTVLDVKKDNADKDGLSTHHLFLQPFKPVRSGFFKVDVKFTNKVANKKANVTIDIWTFQIK